MVKNKINKKQKDKLKPGARNIPIRDDAANYGRRVREKLLASVKKSGYSITDIARLTGLSYQHLNGLRKKRQGDKLFNLLYRVLEVTTGESLDEFFASLLTQDANAGAVPPAGHEYETGSLKVIIQRQGKTIEVQDDLIRNLLQSLDFYKSQHAASGGVAAARPSGRKK
jgi:transcriptional regulator with XRE-family HTH domain